MPKGSASAAYTLGHGTIGRKVADSKCSFNAFTAQSELQTRLNRAEELLRECLPYLPNEASRQLELAASTYPGNVPKETKEILQKMYWEGARKAVNLQHSIEDFFSRWQVLI